MTPRLAILTLDFYPDPGGVQTYLYEIARRMDRTFRIIVLTPIDVPVQEPGGLKLQLVGHGAASQYLAALRRLRPGRVLVGHAHPRLLIPAALYAKQYALLAHGNDFLAAQQRWHRPLFNYLLRRARPLIAPSHRIAGLLRGLGCPRPAVVQPGTDPQRFAPGRGPASATELLTVSRLVSRKGIDTMLGALPILLAEFPDLRYRIAGDGPDRDRLVAMSRELGIEHAVDFLGFIAQEALPELYRSASVFVMPGREEPDSASIEGFGIAYLEAAASGLPVIAGRSGGAVEAVRDGETGFLIPPQDPAGLAGVLKGLLRDPDRRARMGQAGRQWVEREMNWDRAARQLIEALG